jgi:hypothetical protein
MNILLPVLMKDPLETLARVLRRALRTIFSWVQGK